MDGVELIVTAEAEASEGRLSVAGRVLRCALGGAGISTETREGDGATPVGAFALRRLLYRPDRLIRPRTGLPISPGVSEILDEIVCRQTRDVPVAQ